MEEIKKIRVHSKESFLNAVDSGDLNYIEECLVYVPIYKLVYWIANLKED